MYVAPSTGKCSMHKYLFIDRDGTIIEGPPSGGQIDGFGKLHFYPGAITYLHRIAAELPYKLVMVTNQNGLGTDVFPEETFLPVQNFVLEVLKNEEVVFCDVIIDGSYPADNSALRKPRTGRMKAYLNNPEVDMANSFVIGDRITDVQFAKNLGCKAIFLNPENMRGASEITDTIEYLKANTVALASDHWKDVYEFLKGL
jgi:imidazoleglycerol-phosphate dehydratase / histidinol-phosphatase